MSALLSRAALRHFARRPGQLGLAVLGIAMGVALAVGIDVGTATVRRAFALSSEAVTGRATHHLTGGPAGMAEDVYRQLRLTDAWPGGGARVPPLAPVVEGSVVPERGGGALRILGIDPLAEGPFRGPGSTAGGLSMTALGALMTIPGAVVIGEETASAMGVREGQTIAVRAGGRRTLLTVVGVSDPPDPQQRRAAAWLAIADISTAQEVLGMVGRLSRIELILPEAPRRKDGPADATRDESIQALAMHLPSGVLLTAVAARGGALAQMTSAFDLNLRALSLLALLVGAFLIYNTMSFSVVQRRSTLAILRTLGATRGALGRALLVEALVLGAVASGLGLLLGVALSRGLTHLIARAVSNLYFAVAVTDVAIPLGPLLRGFVLGVVAAVVSAVPAARDATSTAPSVALHRSNVEARSRRRSRKMVLGALSLAVVAAASLWLSERSLALALGALLALLVASAALVPALVWLAARMSAVVLGALRGATGRLAARGIAAGLSRTGVAAAALTLALSVTVGLGVMVASFRVAVATWLASTLRADVYISAPSTVGARAEQPLAPALVARLAAVPGVAAVGTNRIVSVTADGVPTLMMAIDPGQGDRLGAELLVGDIPAVEVAFAASTASARDVVLISEPLAFKRGFRAGGTITLATDRGPHPFQIVGVYRDYATDAGALMIPRATYDRFYDDDSVTGIALRAASGMAAEDLVARVRARLGAEDAVVVRSNRTLREMTMRIFDRTFEVTSVLRLIALIVAAVGVTSALMALGLERQRELATLRALGATPAQIAEISIVETALLGSWAGLFAIPLGMLLATVLVHVINQRSFGWTMPLTFDARVLALAPGLGLVAGLFAGLVPAWRAARVIPAIALREE